MNFSTLGEWLAWLEQLHPTEIELGLARVRQVYDSLSIAQQLPTVITVAGTNGKGSTVAMLDGIYRHAGYAVGCFTSPHLIDYNERIRINGEMAEDALICQAFTAIEAVRGETSLTYFEYGTLAALWCFAQSSLDVVVLEIGLGGRLDAVNIVDAEVAMISSIGIDHQAWLGDDREVIGREKAGIFRANRVAICGDPSPPQSLQQVADEVGAKLLFLGEQFGWKKEAEQAWGWHSDTHRRHSLPFPALRGEVQLNNAAAVLMALESLQQVLPVNQQAVRAGLSDLELPGRFQVLPGMPRQILDVAHNVAAAQALADNLKEQVSPGYTLAVVGMLADKDVTGVVSALNSQVDQWFLADLNVPRGLTAAELEPLLVAQGGQIGGLFPSVAAARAAALEKATQADRIVIFGSFYTVAEVLHEHV